MLYNIIIYILQTQQMLWFICRNNYITTQVLSEIKLYDTLLNIPTQGKTEKLLKLILMYLT